MNYNSQKKYNLKASKGGLTYNSIEDFILIKIYEALSPQDSISERIARLIVEEKIKATQRFDFSTLLDAKEMFYLTNEQLNRFVLFDLTEKLNIKQELIDTLIYLQINDRFDIIDQFKELNALISQKESFKSTENLSYEGLISVAEQYSLKEVSKWLAFMEKTEYINLIDKDPRKGISDFYVGQLDNFDQAFDWLSPFNMIVDWRNTDIQIMPQTESDYIDVPNVDGSIIENTVYKNRLFNIVAWTKDGLNIEQKEQIKKQIADILDSTKNESKKLTFGNTGTSFDVKYSGLLDLKEAPSSIKVTIPFEASAYGYNLLDQEVYGSGLIVNNGDKDTGVIHIIRGGCSNPNFKLGDVEYSWKGTVPINSKLYINHQNYTCYLETNEGKRTNVLDKLSGEFQTIPKGKSLPITCFGETEEYISTQIKELILW